MILIINFLVFIILNILNSVLVFTLDQNPLFGVQLNLPGTGSGGSDPLVVSFLLYLIFIISPLVASFSLFFNYRDVNSFSKNELEKVLKPLSKDTQIIIIENLKTLNNKIREQLNFE